MGQGQRGAVSVLEQEPALAGRARSGAGVVERLDPPTGGQGDESTGGRGQGAEVTPGA